MKTNHKWQLWALIQNAVNMSYSDISLEMPDPDVKYEVKKEENFCCKTQGWRQGWRQGWQGWSWSRWHNITLGTNLEC